MATQWEGIAAILREQVLQFREQGRNISSTLNFGAAIVTELEDRNVTAERIKEIVRKHLKEMDRDEANELRTSLRRVLAQAAGVPETTGESEMEEALNSRSHSRWVEIARLRGLETLSDEEFNSRFPTLG